MRQGFCTALLLTLRELCALDVAGAGAFGGQCKRRVLTVPPGCCSVAGLQVIRTLNAKRAPGTPELPINNLEQQNVRTGGHKDPYDAAHMHCFDAVSRWYACDIENYGFANAAEAQLAEV